MIESGLSATSEKNQAAIILPDLRSPLSHSRIDWIFRFEKANWAVGLLKTTGTLLNRFPLTETSLIVHWCTAGAGIIKTVAKGARRPGSPFAGKLDLFFLCDLEIHLSAKSDLHTLKEASVADWRKGLRESYTRTLAASYFVKLLTASVEAGSPVPEFDDLLNRALNYLDQQGPSLRAVFHYEKQIAHLLGLDVSSRSADQALLQQLSGLPPQREELLRRLESP